MALSPCRECGQDVSTEAKFCPLCGIGDPTGKNERRKRERKKKLENAATTAAGIGCMGIGCLGQVAFLALEVMIGLFVLSLIFRACAAVAG